MREIFSMRSKNSGLQTLQYKHPFFRRGMHRYVKFTPNAESIAIASQTSCPVTREVADELSGKNCVICSVAFGTRRYETSILS